MPAVKTAREASFAVLTTGIQPVGWKLNFASWLPVYLVGAVRESLSILLRLFVVYYGNPKHNSGEPLGALVINLQNELIVRGLAWPLYAFFLLAGMAFYLSSRLASRQVVLPGAWARLGWLTAIGCWLAVLAALVGELADVPGASLVGQLSMLVVAAALAPAWSIWLGRELSRS